MSNVKLIFGLFSIALFTVLFTSQIVSQDQTLQKINVNSKQQLSKDPMKRTESEWKRILTKEEYRVLREKGTERAFTGKYDGFYEDGKYLCSGCDNNLFASDTKYKSGCGWPAFYDVVPGSVVEVEDNSYGMNRVEIICSKCESHLGHVFKDGPEPTGLRYCINSVSMDFKPDEE